MNINTAQSSDQFLTRSDFLSFWHSRPTAEFVAADLISAIEDAAQRRCGLHWEIYEAVLLRGLRDKAASLPADHRLTFMQELGKRRISIDEATIAAAEEAERDVWDDIYADQV
ncbi:hypothetical protein CXB34_24445 [Pseudomonas amygdali pv. morsprunorum]|uniref:hypothetical protein n=1 Tax=Pseudomonas syringae group TaxID=136849 RepID=UPI000CDA868B|nr:MULTISPECIES: hypothetical protein [Pseudomonas syringae group]POP81082.1 hypothetical protein CXB34_24445 [Pseudomonas amygdali pv. morsprunorum]